LAGSGLGEYGFAKQFFRGKLVLLSLFLFLLISWKK